MQDLLTPEQAEGLQQNFLEHYRCMDDDRPFDPEPVVKLFTPDANATWLVTEQDPEDPDVLFGIGDLGIGCPEMGTIPLSELQAWRGALGMHVERDSGFTARGTLKQYLTLSNRKGFLDTYSNPKAA